MVSIGLGAWMDQAISLILSAREYSILGVSGKRRVGRGKEESSMELNQQASASFCLQLSMMDSQIGISTSCTAYILFCISLPMLISSSFSSCMPYLRVRSQDQSVVRWLSTALQAIYFCISSTSSICLKQLVISLRRALKCSYEDSRILSACSYLLPICQILQESQPINCYIYLCLQLLIGDLRPTFTEEFPLPTLATLCPLLASIMAHFSQQQSCY